MFDRDEGEAKAGRYVQRDNDNATNSSAKAVIDPKEGSARGRSQRSSH
jgi:hypothetical protein